MYINKEYFILVIYMLISSMLVIIFSKNNLSVSEVFNGFIRILFYIITIMFIIDKIKYTKLINYYKKVSAIVMVLFFIQIVLYYILNIKVIFKIPLLNLFLNRNIEFSSNTMFRPSSVFLEPSWLVIYLAPYLVYSLFKKNNIIITTITSGVILLSTSSLGVIVVFSLMICKLIINTKLNLKNVILIVAFIMILSIFMKTPYMKNTLSRLDTVGSSASTSMRLYRGPNIYKQLPNINKIFGVSIGNLENFINSNGKVNDVYYYSGSKEFVNDIAYIFITTGLIGGILYLYFLIKLYITSSMYLKINILLFLIIASVNPMLTNYIWLFYTVILFSIKLDSQLITKQIGE